MLPLSLLHLLKEQQRSHTGKHPTDSELLIYWYVSFNCLKRNKTISGLLVKHRHVKSLSYKVRGSNTVSLLQKLPSSDCSFLCINWNFGFCAIENAVHVLVYIFIIFFCLGTLIFLYSFDSFLFCSCFSKKFHFVSFCLLCKFPAAY